MMQTTNLNNGQSFPCILQCVFCAPSPTPVFLRVSVCLSVCLSVCVHVCLCVCVRQGTPGACPHPTRRLVLLRGCGFGALVTCERGHPSGGVYPNGRARCGELPTYPGPGLPSSSCLGPRPMSSPTPHGLSGRVTGKLLELRMSTARLPSSLPQRGRKEVALYPC